ncbi:hypothetical protein K3495_g9871 [Podosphaera aphanis]|nr:hypothetical protein K3495_g9871 [Podosphaera aphanis]
MATLFPHLTSTAEAPTSRVLSQAYRELFAHRVAGGTLRPFVLPYNFWGEVALIVYLCIPHKDHPLIYAARWPVLAAITWFQWRTLWESSSMSAATGYAVGMSAMWILLWSWTWLVFSRPQWDAKRVQRGVRLVDADRKLPGKPSSEWLDDDTRKQQHEGTGTENSHRPDAQGGDLDYVGEKSVTYFWQPYPERLVERIPWVIDLVTNFRGPGWNWVIPTLPLLPPNVLAELREPVPAEAYANVSRAGYQRFMTRGELVRSRVPRFVLGYFVLDALKVIMMKDPYYKFGPTTYALPWYLQSLSPLGLHIYRQLLSSGTLIVWLNMLFFLPPLLLSIICGPKLLGLRAESWYYPSGWGAFSTLYSKGLAALWGKYWHQTFRHCFTTPTKYLIQNRYLKPRSTATTLVSVLFAFGISGLLHWAAGVCLYGPARPSRNAIFFIVQPLGILLQKILCVLLRPCIRVSPQKIRYLGNFLFTFVWMVSTGWILADDFARGGLWLWEPIPLSPLRGLGFGEPDVGWWCWEHIGVGWYSGQHWWDSGIAF